MMTPAACRAEPSRPVRPTTVVGLGDMAVSADPEAVLITYALGSCLGMALYDPVARVGALLHAMLPRSDIDLARAQVRPSVFVDTGVPALFRSCYALGARKERLRVWLAGAGTLHDEGADHFQIGKRNLLVARQLLWKNSVLVHAQDVGGGGARTMTLDIGSGELVIRASHGQSPS
jgi:chemotaxis protein CheD